MGAGIHRGYVETENGKSPNPHTAARSLAKALSLNARPFHLGQLSEFVHHLAPGVEFIATDLGGDIFGGITRLQMIELLKLVVLPDCGMCDQNHGRMQMAPDDKIAALRAEVSRLRAIVDSPDPHDFWPASEKEAQFQQVRWGNDGDAGKTDADWFWLIGHVGTKVLYAQTTEKKLPRITTIAAAAKNWHAATLGDTSMRPGIESTDV